MGESLYQRADDTAEALPKRLEGYHTKTTPILEYYKDIVKRVKHSSKVCWCEEGYFFILDLIPVEI